MSRTQRTITIGLWGLVVLSLLGLLALTRWEARASQARAAEEARAAAGEVFEIDLATGDRVPATQKVADLDFPAPTFRLTDQQGKPFDSSELRGKVWTAMFFFSECTGVCPSMTERIVALQRVTDDARVHCVSFSVDPARDTPEKLAKYAEKTKADQSRWHLLTGDAGEAKRVAREFKLAYNQPVDHSSKIMLVDAAGVVRGYYESLNTEEMFKLNDEIKRLLAEQPTAAADRAGATAGAR